MELVDPAVRGPGPGLLMHMHPHLRPRSHPRSRIHTRIHTHAQSRGHLHIGVNMGPHTSLDVSRVNCVVFCICGVSSMRVLDTVPSFRTPSASPPSLCVSLSLPPCVRSGVCCPEVPRAAVASQRGRCVIHHRCRRRACGEPAGGEGNPSSGECAAFAFLQSPKLQL